MKRTVSLVLAAALVLGSIPAGFAATAGETLKGYGVVAGDTNGSLNEDKTITRAEMMTVLARLLGKFEEASKYSIPSTSKDVAGHWNANVIAFAEKEGWTAGKGNGMFDPQGVVTLQETAAFMLKALGYTITDYAKVVEEATAKGLLKDVVAKELTAPVKRSDVFASALNTLNTPSKDATVKLGEKLGYFKSEALTVGEIKANAANSFQVKFNKAVDPTKVAFAVKRENTAATVTTTWNTEKTMATLTYASKLPEGNYEVTVNDTTTADKPVVMATQKVVIEKEKIAKVEVASETLLRYSETKGYVPYKVTNQYGEDVTNTTLGRSLDVIQTLGGGAGNTVVLKRDAGIAIFTYDVAPGNRLRNLPSVVFTLQDTTAGFVFTKTLKVSETANAIAEVKINGIVNEKGEKVDFVWSRTKAYYLDVTVLDTNGQEIKSLDVLKAVDNNVPVLQVRASDSTNIDLDVNGYVRIGDAPGKTNVAAWRLAIKSPASPTYDTPVTFSVIAPFGTTGKNNATFTTTLKRAAKVEKFTMLAPAEIATPNRDVEFFFEAFDQNGEKVTAYDDLNGNIQFSTTAVKFVKQANGSAKLIGNFLTNQLYYVTATVTGSLTGSFSQVAVDVKEPSNDARIQALAHARLYTPGASWTVASDKFVIKDKYDRTLNLKVDNEALNYNVKVTSSNPAIVSVAEGASKTVFGGSDVVFKGGNTYGTAIITYELFNGTKSLSSASAVVYNVDTKDVRSIALAPSADPTYMTSKDTTGKFYTAGANTDLGNGQGRALNIVGKTKDGSEVRLNSALVTYKTTNQGFTAASTFKANKDFPSTATSATTVASAQYNNGSDILTATATVNASADKPVASVVTVDADSALRRSGVIKFSSDVLTVSAADFATKFVTKSVYSYHKETGAAVANQAPVFFNAESQYGDYVIDKVDVIPAVTNKGTLTIDSTTGEIDGAVQNDDIYTVTVSTENGKTKVITINIAPVTVATGNVANLVTIADYEGAPVNTSAQMVVSNGKYAAAVAAAGTDAVLVKRVQAKADANAIAMIEVLEALTNSITAKKTATTPIPVPPADIVEAKAIAAAAAIALPRFTADVPPVTTKADLGTRLTNAIAVVTAGQTELLADATTKVNKFSADVAAANTAAKVDAVIADNGAAALAALNLVDPANPAVAGLTATLNAAKATVASKVQVINAIKVYADLNDASGLDSVKLTAIAVTHNAAALDAYRTLIAGKSAADVDTAVKIQNLINTALVNTDATDVIAAMTATTAAAIKGGNTDLNTVKTALTLNTTHANGTTIVWTSSTPAIVAANGAVTQSNADDINDVVTLTATFTKGTYTDTKTFTVTVLENKVPTVAAPTTKMLTATTFQITFSEAVNAVAGDFTNVMIDADGGGVGVAAPAVIASIAGSGTSTITVTLTAPIAGYDALATVGTVDIGAGVVDLHGNAITPVVAQPIALQ